MNIFLIGYRCTGKTTVAKKLAEVTGKKFIDADEVLVEKAGMTVAEIVEASGWDVFRDRETNVLKDLCNSNDQIIATGGGVILREENIAAMKAAGTVFWLTATVETIAARLAADAKSDEQRPALTDKGVINEIKETLDFRTPLYENAMDFMIDSNQSDFHKICQDILDKLSDE